MIVELRKKDGAHTETLHDVHRSRVVSVVVVVVEVVVVVLVIGIRPGILQDIKTQSTQTSNSLWETVMRKITGEDGEARELPLWEGLIRYLPNIAIPLLCVGR